VPVGADADWGNMLSSKNFGLFFSDEVLRAAKAQASAGGVALASCALEGSWGTNLGDLHVAGAAGAFAFGAPRAVRSFPSFACFRGEMCSKAYGRYRNIHPPLSVLFAARSKPRGGCGTDRVARRPGRLVNVSTVAPTVVDGAFVGPTGPGGFGRRGAPGVRGRFRVVLDPDCVRFQVRGGAPAPPPSRLALPSLARRIPISAENDGAE
jgi:hypothetical protein